MDTYHPNQIAGSGQHIHLHMFSTVFTGNALQVVQSSTAILGVYAVQNAAALNDYWLTYLYLEKGAYSLKMLHGKHNLCGITTLDIQSAGNVLLQVNVDMYQAGGTVLNFVYSNTLTMPQAGKVQLAGLVGSKNASSGGYTAPIQAIIFTKTGD